ncbi:unnamed protein product [Rotaria socialis]
MGTIGIAIAAPPTGCTCGNNGACTTAGCGVGNDTTCTHGYYYDGGYYGYACACPGYSTTSSGGYYIGGGATARFANCGAFGNAIR